MPHYCRICNTYKANEKFSGKGHKTHVCKTCSTLPKTERDRVDIANDLYGFWTQTRISPKNIVRLKELIKYDDSKISELATVLLEVAELFPSKKKRVPRIAKENPGLFARLEKVNLIHENYFYGDFDSFDDY